MYSDASKILPSEALCARAAPQVLREVVCFESWVCDFVAETETAQQLEAAATESSIVADGAWFPGVVVYFE